MGSTHLISPVSFAYGQLFSEGPEKYLGSGKRFYFEIFRFFDPQNLSESLQIGGGWFGGIFPDIFYFFEKIAFLAILARLALQNVQVVFQNDQNGHFWPFLAIFGVPKVRDPPKSIRMRSRNTREVSPEKLWGHYGTGRGILGDPWAYIGPLGRFPYMEAHFGLQKSTFWTQKWPKRSKNLF